MTLDPNALAAALAIEIQQHGTKWFLVDGSTAEPEVNWPGDLISEHDYQWQAQRALSEAAITAYLAALPSTTLGETETPVPRAPARPANAELVERLCSSVQALIAALPPNPAEGLFLQAEATAEQCRRTLAAMLTASPSQPALDGAAPDNVLTDIWTAYAKARAKHAPMHGPHEGYAVLLEEVDELWDEVKRWQPDDQNATAMRKEALHVAAMALAFLLEVVPTPPKETR